MAVQPGLCRTWSETPKTGFLRTRLNLFTGRRGENGTEIAMRQVKSSAYPQDNMSGMMVATQQGDNIVWEIDPFIHFECVQSKSL